MRQKFSRLEKENISTLELADEIKTMLVDNARKCRIKTKKLATPDNLSAPWFDTECCGIKNEIRRLGNKVKKDPGNEQHRNLLFAQKRNF